MRGVAGGLSIRLVGLLSGLTAGVLPGLLRLRGTSFVLGGDTTVGGDTVLRPAGAVSCGG